MTSIKPMRHYIPHLDTRQELKSLETVFQKYSGDERNSDSAVTQFLNRLMLRSFILLSDKRVISQNYKIISLFKIERIKGFKKILANVNLATELLFGKFILFDTFLTWCTNKNHESWTTSHFFVTEISELHQYIQSLLNGDKVYVYVYSWDHIYKNIFYSNRVAKYFVWNEQQATALTEVHGIQHGKIHIVGSTLFSSLHEYLKTRALRHKMHNDTSRVKAMFAMSTGTKMLQQEELDYFEKLLQMNPNIDFLLRLYPFYDASKIQRLTTYRNFLGLDTEFFSGKNDDSAALGPHQKYDFIDNCDLFLHFGTTLGVEAAYLNTRSILLYPNGRTHKRLRSFAEQSQLKWLRSVARKEDQVMRLPEFLEGFELVDEIVQKYFPLKSLDAIISDIEGATYAD